jgi:SH3-like domain-containing protein
MRDLFLIALFFSPLSSWGDCKEINAISEQFQSIIPTSESTYVVIGHGKNYFYTAPDESCKLKNLFIIKGDIVNVYAEYKDYSSVLYFKKNGDPVSGWIHSDSIKSTRTGVGPS